uniref:F-box domain-containing protein n=1 Tax=Caenorhabditis tropicalis TaxID=1561998 RepID=A0A1I7UTQ8_9PELO
MNLLHLPLLPLIQIFKNMDFREKFLISLMSKRANKTLKKTAVPIELSFQLASILYIHSKPYDISDPIRESKVNDEASDHLIRGEKMSLSLYPDGVSLQDQSLQKQLLLAQYVLDTFTKLSIHAIFSEPILPSTALEFMKLINQKKASIQSFYYDIDSESSEFIPRILDECIEVTDSILIHADFPDDFIYTPPRPFKVRELRVSERTNWLNLESFMNCRRISLQLGKNTNRTPQSWNTFFRNWLESDTRLEDFSCIYVEDTDFPLIVDGLSNEGTKERFGGAEEWIDVKRRDGSEFVIGRSLNAIHIWTKQAHLKHLLKQEELLFMR